MKLPILFSALLFFTSVSALAADLAGTSASQANVDGSMVSITALASTMKPYQNQSIQYTVRCVLRGSISDASLGDISVNNAIVEQQGKPNVRDQYENGLAVRIIEFHFIITPLQSGTITIPSAVMQGKIRTPDITDSFGGGLSSGMRQALSFFSAFGDEPFKVASNQLQLEVKPPATTMDPWLPLTSLRIMEDTSASQPVRVGEPLTQKITLLADGAVGGQLPDIEAKQDQKNFRVYADKPTTGEDVDTKSGMVLGWRKESYTLIPQKAGQSMLPAIKVRWWDTVNNKVAVAELPERVIDVLPVAAAQNLPPVGGRATGRSALMQSLKGATVPSNFGSLLLYSLMGVLAGMLLFGAFWRSKFWRKMDRQEMNSSKANVPENQQQRKSAPRSVTERDLGNVRAAEELERFLQAYMHARCGVSKNASLEKSFQTLSNSWAAKEREDVDAVINGIGAALYAGKVVELEDLKKRCWRILAALNRESKNSRKDGEKLQCLNPS